MTEPPLSTDPEGSAQTDEGAERGARRGKAARPDDREWPFGGEPATDSGRDPRLETELKYRALFEAIDEGFCVIEMLLDEHQRPVDYRIVEVNAAFQAQTGLEDVLGKTARALRPNLEEHWVRIYGEIARTGEPRRFQKESADAGRWYDVYAFRIGIAEQWKLGVLFRDITRRRNRERELRESEERFRTLSELSPDAILVNLEDRIVYANEAAARLLGGADAAEIGERNPLDFIEPEYHERVRERIRRVLEGGGPAELIEQRWRTRNGTILDVEVNAGRIRWNGRPAVQVVARDISQRKRKEEELRRAKATAEEANRSKSEFMATISHELRTPLNAIIGYTELLAEGVPESVPTGAEEQVRRISHGARHLRQLISEVLTFSRMEAGRESAELEAVSLPDLLDEVRSVIGPLTRDTGVRLVIDAAEAPDTFRSDGRKLRQILVNLLGNAVKFTDRGTVSLEVAGAEKHLLFRVTDQGPGIDPEEQERLFEPFWQGGRGCSGEAGGAGLGLTISKRYAELMGGDLSVESTRGAGSVFTLRLPR